MASKTADSSIRLEDRISLAVKAYKNGHFKSVQAAAAAYDVPHSTLAHHINGQKARSNIPVNCQKLTNLEEASLKKWILDMDDRGLPPTQDIICKMADLLLSQRKSGLFTGIGKNWVSNFIKQHDDLTSKYTCKYDYQCAKCEDPEIINWWFDLVQNTIVKYGILEQDIYNFDETGF
jgi:hypothetical protein